MTNSLRPENIQWDTLGFSYIETDYRWIQYYKDGQWQEGELTEDNTLHISEASTALHYGQSCFEGMKAYRTKDGSINLFRPEVNGQRMRNSAKRLAMEAPSVDDFVQGVVETVRANQDWVPPYGSGSTLYIRPLLIGVGDTLGVKPAKEYIFTVFVSPVGPYYQNGLQPTKFITTDYDRAAPHGTGAAKAGGNYGGSLIASRAAQEKGYGDAIYLNPADKSTIEEIGSSNFFAITEDNTFVTPQSPSVLPGVTRRSLMELAKNRFGMDVEERPIKIEECANFIEAGSCGTAAVITPISGIRHGDTYYEFYSETEIGPITQKLYDELTGIQSGDVEAPEGWITKVQ